MKIKQLSLFFLLCISGVSFSATSDKFEFGAIEGEDCITQDCTITFRNTYVSPLVFLLSSFDYSNYTDDVPSAAVLSSMSPTEATVRQKFPLNNASGQQPMQSIQYIVVEEGDVFLDPNQPSMVAEAGYIDGVSYVGTKVLNKDRKWLDIQFKNTFGARPIVFTQLQVLTQSSIWATTTNRNVSTSGFQTAIELGRRPNTLSDTTTEKIAYLAIQPFDGVTPDNISFVIGEKTMNQNPKGYKAIETLKWSCDNNTFSLPASFEDNYRTILTKQTRQGGDGGWLRVCKGLADNTLSVMFEEDAISRKHGAFERVGYLAFEKAQAAFGQCDYFPAVAQTWDSNFGELEIKDTAQIVGPPQGKWVGFSPSKVDATSTSCVDENGSAQTCLGNTDYLIDEYAWNESPPWAPENLPVVSPPHTITSSGDMILYPGDYSSLPTDTLHTSQKYIFAPGNYWIQNIMLAGNEFLSFPIDKVTLNVSSILISGNVVINTQGNPDDLVIVAHTTNGNIALSSNNLFNSLIISRNKVDLSGPVIIRGAVSTKKLTLTGNAQIIGQSSCFEPIDDLELVVMPSSGEGLSCDGIKVDFSLMDSNGDIVDGNGENLFVTSSSVSGSNSACWSFDGNITSSQCNKSSDSEFSVNFPIGSPATVTRYIHSKFLNSYNIEANVSSENLITSAGPYEFIPKSISIVPSEGVDSSDNNQVAGRPFPFRLKIRGKEGNGNQLTCKIIKEDVDVSVDFSHNKMPSSSIEALELSHNSGTWEPANKSILISFKDGVAGGDENNADGSLLARFNDAGITDFSANSVVSGKLFSATERFYFRPFTAAICGQSNALPAFTNETNGAAFSAGTDFNGYLKAVNWIKSLDVDNSGYGNGIPDRNNPPLVCSEPVTPSYVTHNGYTARLTPTVSLTYPLGGNVNTLTADGSAIASFNKEITSVNRNVATIFNWSDVGTLSFDVIQESYFNIPNFNIPSTKANVGRFYPAYFEITDTIWDYPGNQGSVSGSYIYMDQNFTDVSFEVRAYNSSGTETENYGLFSDGLKASFSLVDLSSADNSERLNITDADLEVSHWNSGALWKVTGLDDAVTWKKKQVIDGSSPLLTKEDGPFNMSGNSNSVTTALGLKISGVDPVSFDATSFDPTETEQELLSQPDVRYGRMALDSVGAASGESISVPLSVEYWNGLRFTLSDNDNAATFNGDYYCKQTIWPDGSVSSGSILSSGESTVKSGFERELLKAEPDGTNSELREQVRFWLQLTSDKASSNCSLGSPANEQPWLQYNWRGQGDEDPSTVVTFGIYRGNDRVIFRGESNIIGTSN